MESLARRDALLGLVLVRDSVIADAGHRVVSSLLKTLLLDGSTSVLMVTSRYSTAHYSTMLRRLNLNVSKIAADGRFKVLNTNGLCRLDEAADRYLVDLKPLMDAVVGDLSSFSSPHRAVVFDDVISLLSACRADPLTACRAVAGLSPESVACRILVLHEDVDDFSSVVKALSHEAATVVSLKSLASGSSAEIEARVEVLRRKVGGGVSGADLGVVEGAVSR